MQKKYKPHKTNKNIQQAMMKIINYLLGFFCNVKIFYQGKLQSKVM